MHEEGGGGRPKPQGCSDPTHLPSVHRLAEEVVTTAVPALPVNPDRKARRSSQAATYSLCKTQTSQKVTDARILKENQLPDQHPAPLQSKLCLVHK